MKAITSLFFCAMLASCAMLPSGPDVEHVSMGSKVSLNDSRAVKSQLYAQYSEWKGTRHEMGGLSKKGIDCSGFIFVTYKSKLGIEIPRSTALQSKLGKNISKKKLRAGDLVFFKTSESENHAGMYIEDGKFLHVSSSKGVIISDLDNVYWNEKYWMARRL